MALRRKEQKINRTYSSAESTRPLLRWFAVLTLMVATRSTANRFAQLCDRWCVQHPKATPRYPQSNGHAEAVAKAMKTLIIIKSTTTGDLVWMPVRSNVVFLGGGVDPVETARAKLKR